MRNMLPTNKPLLGTLVLSVMTIFLSACTADNRPPEEPPEINTYKAFVSNEQIKYVAVQERSFSIHTLADFTKANDQFTQVLELDTDEDKQGYEYAAFIRQQAGDVNSSQILLLDYDKSTRGQIISIAQVTGTICGIKPVYKPSSFAYSDHASSSRALKNAAEVVLLVAENQDACLIDDNVYYESVSFQGYLDRISTKDEDEEENLNTNTDATDFSRTTISKYEANKTLVVNYAASTDAEEYGYLVHNPFSGLTFNYYKEGKAYSWQTPALLGDVTIKQASDKEVMFWNTDLDSYVTPVASLFTVGDTSLGSDIDTPIQKQIDALFESVLFTFPDAGQLSLNTFADTSNFTVVNDNKLYYFDRANNPPNPFYQLVDDRLTNAQQTIISHELTQNNDVILVKQLQNSRYLLSIVDTNFGSESSLLNGASAEQVELIINSENIFTNTYNLDNNSDWQAHKISKSHDNYEHTTYDGNNRIIELKDLNNLYDELILLAFNTLPDGTPDNYHEVSQGNFIFAFNADANDGRQQTVELINNSYYTVDRYFGWFLDIIPGKPVNAIKINNEFSRLTFEAVLTSGESHENVHATYVLDLSDDNAAPEFREQSLIQVNTESL